MILFSAIATLRESGIFSDMSLRTDEDEHSIEMHLPYVRKVFAGQVGQYYNSYQPLTKLSRLDIKIVPILVGTIDKITQAKYGAALAPYLAEPDTICIISSDFCHW
jgi:predicted class III extradiol MEMO1 family dioxygenase